MPTEQRDFIEQRFDFSTWKGINRLDQDLLVRNISLPKDLVAGLDTSRIREIDPGDGSKLLRASWAAPGHKDAVLVMDIRECESRDTAHQVLLELLENMQSPDVKRLEESDLGDIAFAHDSTTAVIFARGNIVFNISNGGEKVIDVNEIAKTIDHWLMKQRN
jgi:hypothetical protein